VLQRKWKLDHDLPEELEQMLVKGEEDKIDGGILDLQREKLFSIEDLYSVLEDDWGKIICPTILEYQGVEGYLGDNPEEANPHYFNGFGAMEISPSEDKIAFDLDNYGACPSLKRENVIRDHEGK